MSDQYSPRERLLALVARAELDPDGFGAELKADPEAALEKAGFSASQSRGLRQEAGPAELMSGCADTTCFISICPDTCFITIRGGGCPIFSCRITVVI